MLFLNLVVHVHASILGIASPSLEGTLQVFDHDFWRDVRERVQTDAVVNPAEKFVVEEHRGNEEQQEVKHIDVVEPHRKEE